MPFSWCQLSSLIPTFHGRSSHNHSGMNLTRPVAPSYHAINAMAPLYYVCIVFLSFASGLNITIFSLDFDDCKLAEIETSTEETYIQLLQLPDYDRTKIQQNKVEIDHIIFYCGMHSYISTIQNGRRIYRPCRKLPANDYMKTAHGRQCDYFRNVTKYSY